MKKLSSNINGIMGKCGQLPVFIGFASAKFLWNNSFTDILNEDTGEGYQRPYNKPHSLDFRNYILKNRSSSPPLTFNLRKELSKFWRIKRGKGNYAELILKNEEKCLAQVDCQHRLGELGDIEISLAFMAFIGLDLRQEMAIFNVINSKAKGLNSSLTDFHESNLLNDLSKDAPHLYIARKLNESPDSPWYRLIRYGGETTSGLKRRTSLRMMQKTILRFLKHTQGVTIGSVEEKYLLIFNFWKAVRDVFSEEWHDHRHNLLTKGVGLYALMYLFADIVNKSHSMALSDQYFISILNKIKGKVSWNSKGMFSHAGGQKGATEVYQSIKRIVKL